MADRDTTGDMSRFTTPIYGVVRDANGRIVSPPPGPERDRALEIENAWAEYWANDDETELIRLGLFPPRDAE